jgi:hypothetical protein
MIVFLRKSSDEKSIQGGNKALVGWPNKGTKAKEEEVIK